MLVLFEQIHELYETLTLSMAYVVTRTINGKQYKYIQRSFRQGGKVKTVTVEYLGATDPVYDKSRHKNKGIGKGTGALTQSPKKGIASDKKSKVRTSGSNSSSATGTVKQNSHLSGSKQSRSSSLGSTPNSTRQKISAFQSITTQNKPQPVTTHSDIHRAYAKTGRILRPKPTKKTPSLIHKRTNFGTRRISPHRLNEESRQFIACLQSKTGQTPNTTIKLKWGSELSSKWKGNTVVIYCPNKVSPGALRREFHKAHATVALRELKHAHPSAYKQLSKEANTSFKISKVCYAEAVRQGKDWKKQFKAIGVERFGNFQNLKRNFRDPKKWGIYNYEGKQSWKDEMVSIYAESQAQGGLYRFAGSLRREQESAYAVAKHLESLRKPKKDKGLERDIYRANIRSAILAENSRKLATMNALFYPSYGIFPMKQPPR